LNKKLQIIIIFGLFFFVTNISCTVKSIDDNRNILTLEEGMRYEYSWQFPIFYFQRTVEIYVTENSLEAWNGIITLTDPENGTTFLYKFKISKKDMSLCTTETLDASEIFDERVKPYRIKRGDPGLVSFFFPILYNGYNIEDLLKNKTSLLKWGAGEETYRVDISDQLEYKNFSCYRLTITSAEQYLGSSESEIYISTSPPYLLVTQYYEPGNEKIKLLDLKTVEKAAFNIGKYNIKTNSNSPPKVNFTYVVNDLVVQFNSTSYDPDGYITNYSWDFGDGNVSYEENPIHKYAEPGRYRVTLKARDDENTSWRESRYINVQYFQGEDSEGEANYTEGNEEKPPEIIIVNITYPKEVKSNQDFKINITIENKGSGEIFWGDILKDGVKIAEIPLSSHLMVLEGQTYTTNLTMNISKTTKFTIKVGHYSEYVSEDYKILDDMKSFIIICEEPRNNNSSGFELFLVFMIIFLFILYRKRHR